MVALLTAWIISFLCMFAIGDYSIWLWNKYCDRQNSFGVINTFWIGMSITSALVILLNFFIPINIYVLLSFLTLTMVYYFIRRQRIYYIYTTAKRAFLGMSRWSQIFLCLFLLFISISSLQSNIHADFGSYHIQAIKLIQDFPIITGLGNLHGRYAFNSSFFGLNALFCYHPSVYQPFYFLNGLSLVLFSIWGIYMSNRIRSLIGTIAIMVVLLITCYSFMARISSTSTDILGGILIIYLILNLYQGEKYFKDNLLLYAIVPLFCVTLKLSFAPLILFTLYILYILTKQKNFKAFFIVIGIIALFAVPWCIRNIMLSGYLIFPYPQIDLFNVDWKIPEDLVQWEKNFIYTWARNSSGDIEEVANMSFFQWFFMWFKLQSIFHLIIYMITILSIIIGLLNIRKLYKNPIFLLTFFVSLLGFISFFYTAPSLRFGFGFVFSMAAFPYLFLSKKKIIHKTDKRYKISYVLCCLLLFFGLLPTASKEVLRWQENNRHLFWTILYPQSVERIKDVHLGLHGGGEWVQIGNGYVWRQTFGYDDYQFSTTSVNEGLEFRGNKPTDGFRIRRSTNTVKPKESAK